MLIATTLIAVVLAVISYLLLHRQLPDRSFPPDSGVF
jgi:hypothetical protein